MQVDCPHLDWPEDARQTVHLGKTLQPHRFRDRRARGRQPGHAKVIGVVENQAPTKALTAELPVLDGTVQGDADNDVCQIALVERHRGTGRRGQRLRLGLRLLRQHGDGLDRRA